jgi:hypothetical protein
VTPAPLAVPRAPDVVAAVSDAEYGRLLGLPRGRAVSDDVAGRAAEARRWYAGHGRPFVAVRRSELIEIGADYVRTASGHRIAGSALADRLRAGEAHALVVAAVSAGPEVAEEAARLWAAERPDESYFLDRLAAAVAERLIWHASAVACSDATPAGEAMLPHLSPGCGRWGLEAQHDLMTMLLGHDPEMRGVPAGDGELPLGPVTLLASGALRPQHSLLAALGVTRRAIVATPESSCRCCALARCRFRRAAYRPEAGPGATA